MKVCLAPNGSYLPAEHQAFLRELLGAFAAAEYRKSKLEAVLPALVRQLSARCSSDVLLGAWCEEVGQWVRWYRAPAYWLAFVLQKVTEGQGSVYHFLTCSLYADAQTNFADDIALSSIETAYVGFVRNRAALGASFDAVGEGLRDKLRSYHQYYQTWSQPFAYVDANPCADHLYTYLSRGWLIEAADGQLQGSDANDIKALRAVLDACVDPSHAYYRVLARRFLGLRHGADGRPDLAGAEYAAALAEARRLRIDTEIGHLRRLLGTALRATGHLVEARHQFEQAYAYEQLEPNTLFTNYWQALSARELGDTIALMAGRTDAVAQPSTDADVTVDNPDQTLPEALAAYADGRLWFGGHMSVQCPFPIARAAKQQLFRSFSANAMQVACLLRDPEEMLAEVEWNGPREVTELVTECAAARAMSPASLCEFRLNRAKYYATLNTWPASFEDYLAHLVDTWEHRRAYLEQCFALDSLLISAQSSAAIAKQTLRLRIPNTLFLLFHVGQRESIMVVADVSSGVAAPFPVPIGEFTLREIDDDYVRALKDPAGTREAALDLLLSRYADLLGPALEPLLPFLPGKHLKIFPRLHMNAVPFHALHIGGKYLIEHCATVSYGQTLGLLLENYGAAPVAQPASLRMVIGNRVPWYDLLLPKLRALYGSELLEQQQPDWTQLKTALASQPTNDILFACHGVYRPDNIEASRLDLASPKGDGAVRFAQVFAELDLFGRRSVVMGACESGLVRTTVAAEYLGLASAMLSSGVRYVVGALWTIPDVATAALVERYLELVKPADADVPAALCEAQRQVMGMTRGSCAAWISALVPPGSDRERVLDELTSKSDYPFAHPYYWAGLQVVGGL